MAISSFQKAVETFWYSQSPLWYFLLFPFHALLFLLVGLRRALYKIGILKSIKVTAPVIVIGNISVGGTGKTPFAIYLIEKLQKAGLKPGLISRGYGGSLSQKDNAFLVDGSSKVAEVGDEPKMIFNRTGAPIMIDKNRARGAQKLIDEHHVDLVICDDGLQHYKLQRDLDILIVDAKRQFGNKLLLPFGPLREPISRAQSCDLLMENGENMRLSSPQLVALKTTETKNANDLSQENNLAVAAIGNPQRFFDTLNVMGIEHQAHAYPDHYLFSADDFKSVKGNIIMTEKDAVKCEPFADERFYYVSIATELDVETEQLLDNKLKSLIQSFGEH